MPASSRERTAGREDIVNELAAALAQMADRIRSEWARDLTEGHTPENLVNLHYEAQILVHNDAAFAVHSVYNAGLVEDVRLPEILHPEAAQAGAYRQAEVAIAQRQITRLQEHFYERLPLRAEVEFGPSLLNEVPTQERQRTRDYGMGI